MMGVNTETAEQNTSHVIGDSPNLVAMTCYMTGTRNSAMALVPWLYPNSPPSDDPGITTKSSPFLLASQQYLARVPSSPDQPASSPCPGMAWYTVGIQPKIAWWMTVFQVGPLPSMSHLSHRNDDSIAYTEQTMPKQKGRKTSEPSSLPRHSCLWYCRINEPVLSDGCVIQLWEDKHSIKIWGYSLGQVTNSTFSESSFFIFLTSQVSQSRQRKVLII